MNNFEVIIGIEIHVELKTKTKIFSAMPIDFDAPANTCANQIDLGYPGTLPQVNKQAVKYAIALAKALNMHIDKQLRFDRKNYFYPDLPKGYQITQFYHPIGSNGKLTIQTENGFQDIAIERIHLEEDTARQHHNGDITQIDYNRAGVPLIEIVTYPVIKNANEAAAYVDMIKKTVQSLEISEGRLEKGSLRADINISLRPYGVDYLGTKVEIKNMNSLSNIRRAIEYEIKLQTQKILKGETILQQTKRFDDQSNSNVVMRTKTGVVDYRYFPEPNIPFIQLSDAFVDSVVLKELPLERKQRYEAAKIQNIYINSLLDDIELAKYFDSIPYENLEQLSKVFFAEVVSLANSKGVLAYNLGIKATYIAQAMQLLDAEVISSKSLKKLIPLLVDFNGDIDTLLDEYHLKQITDVEMITNLLIEIIDKNQTLVAEYLNRPERVLKFVLGNLMKQTNGQVNPSISNQIATRVLDEKFKK
ncbi:Asp-tRNA(Asn)/Glu-tRNA(Gln) amidotransferase subunit GatB [Mycoplasmopsis mustelae]|uniref:Asp-tRNA(Asn)/Glu-tRNA(Gln) amidotransferase subunit GatB n=1 Tax=Mycoplasmopsis mustelae TaxID=171289 RepID=UPI0010649F17|nr:Asp-tRNA(Asn)/Glu-tRNA(Gln) amidotransferase subunit GatB [Mycoplasmopsis mustelae]